jgi:uncharacterized MAPEG superfamily protein
MHPELSPELYWLVVTTLMTGLFWVPYLLQRIRERRLWPALWDPQGITDTAAPWAARMRRAHGNAVENLVVFAPLVLALQATHATSAVTATACLVYFVARAIHFVVYSLGVPVLRVLAFGVAFGAQLTLALVLLGAV